FGNHVADQLAAVIMLALAPAVPGRVTAGWNALLGSTVNGVDPRSGRPYVDILLNAFKGGGGATLAAAGPLPSTAAFGLFGGGPGSVNEIDFTYPDGRVHRPHLKDL